MYTCYRRKDIEKEDKKMLLQFYISTLLNVWKKEKAITFVNTETLSRLVFHSNKKEWFSNVKQRNCTLQCIKWKYLLSQIKLPDWMGWCCCFYTGLKDILEISQTENTWGLNFFFSKEQILPSTVNSLLWLLICSQR